MGDPKSLEQLIASNSLIKVATALRENRVALADYVDAVQAKCNALEPQLHALIPEPRRFERLREQASELEARYPDPAQRPLLYGVLVGIKDVFHVEGMLTRAGSQLPIEELQGAQGAAVSSLLDAGALVLGKTVTTEFAYFGPGPTRNPLNLEHTPGGSSSGSAAAVAAGYCPLAIGTQTIASTIRPAAFCGIVGFKPSYDRIPQAGIIPVAPSVDTVGVFTADVASMSPAAQVLIKDWHPVSTTTRPVLGVPHGAYLERASLEARAHFDAVLKRLADAGFVIQRVNAFDDFEQVEKRHRALVAAEAAATHAAWFDRYASLYHVKTSELILQGRAIEAATLERARSSRLELRQELGRVMDQQGIDAWITPAATGAAPRTLESTGDPIMSLPWAYVGLPSVAIPSGKNREGLPLGLQMVGQWYRDERLLENARQVELCI